MYFNTENLSKPQNKNWKFVSKFLTRTLPLYSGVIAALPDTAISADIKVWVIAALALAVATISGLSEFTTDPVVDPQSEG